MFYCCWNIGRIHSWLIINQLSVYIWAVSMLYKNTPRPQFKRLLLFSPSVYSETNSDSSDKDKWNEKERTDGKKSTINIQKAWHLCAERIENEACGETRNPLFIASYSFGHSSEGEGPSDKASPSKLLSISFFLIVFYRPLVSYGTVFK